MITQLIILVITVGRTVGDPLFGWPSQGTTVRGHGTVAQAKRSTPKYNQKSIRFPPVQSRALATCVRYATACMRRESLTESEP